MNLKHCEYFIKSISINVNTLITQYFTDEYQSKQKLQRHRSCIKMFFKTISINSLTTKIIAEGYLNSIMLNRISNRDSAGKPIKDVLR